MTTSKQSSLTSKTADPATVSLHHLAKHYGDLKAVNNIDLDIKGGEFMTFLGPSGSGKTTTLKMVAGFVEQTAGEIKIDGKPVTAPPHKRDIGMVFQNYALFPHMTAAQNIGFPLKIRKLSKQEQQKRVQAALDMVHLSDRGGQHPKQLSGGQQQRIALARALVFEPRVVLMDEPLGALDKKLREFLQLEIRHIHQALGITMIYVTHDQEEALVMSDRIAVFNQGKIVQIGTGEELYERPNSPFVADFIGESNIFKGQFRVAGSQGSLHTASFSFKVPENTLQANSPAALVVRPERLHIHAQAEKLGSNTNSLEVTVKEVIYLGSERKFELESDRGDVLIARHQIGKIDTHPAEGDKVVVAWDVEHGVLVPDDEVNL